MSQTNDIPPIPETPGWALRHLVASRELTSFIGVYDALSATLAGRHHDALFVSGYGMAASHYGLPDIGFIAWPDMLAFVQRLRGLLPTHHLLVDLDDGYGDPEIAAHIVAAVERAGASGIVLEDQQRPRRCGHAPGKQVLPLEEYVTKLRRVVAARRDLFVVARTDAADDDERLRRCIAFAEAGADAVLADGITELATLTRIARAVGKPLMFNQIAGGKSPRCTLSELRAAGVSLVNYSTPLLFAAAESVERALVTLSANDGLLPDATQPNVIGVSAFTAMLTRNLSPTAGPASFTSPSPHAFTIDERIAKLSPVKRKLLAIRQSQAGPPTPRVTSADDTVPLSRTQHWFWVASQIDPAGISLNTTRGVRITGPLDLARFERAFARVIERYDILRTVYPAGPPPRQQVLASEVLPLPVRDLAHLTSIDQNAATDRAAADDAAKPIDLTRGPVLRAWLTRLSPTDHLLTMTVHHIAFDGWSTGVFRQDLSDAYAGRLRTDRPALQYADVALSESSTAASSADIAFWAAQFAGLMPMDLPTDRPRPATLTTAGRRYTRTFSKDLADKLKAVGRGHGATLFMTLLAGFKALLRDLCGDDVVVGAPVAGRDRVEYEQLIGPFLNTLVLRTRCQGAATFIDLLSRVRATTVNALRHSTVRFDELVRVTNAARDLGRNPLYDVAFQLRNFPRGRTETGDVRMDIVEPDNGIARCDLQVAADDGDSGLAVTFEYRADLFDASTIEQWAAAYERVLRSVADNPDVALADLGVTQSTSAAISLPLSPTAVRLAAIWAQVLDTAGFDADDDFFAVGGNSLRAVVCSAKAGDTFGVELPVVSFFKTPTLAGLADEIDRLLAQAVVPESAKTAAPARLSPGQQRLWFLNRYETDASAYNVTVARRLRGPLDATRLARAVQVVVRRHEALRTLYPERDGEPAAEVVDAEDNAVQLAVVDLTVTAEGDREAAVARAVDDEAVRRFDLGTLPLLRAKLLRLASDDHALVITLHHIVCDEWSVRLLLSELSAAYAVDADPLPPLAVQYFDFAARQHAWLAGSQRQRQADYWVDHLEGAPAALALPTDRPRPAAQTFRGAHVPLSLPPDVVAKLKSLGRREQVSDFMTTLALFYTLLARWSRQTDLVVGTPVSSREGSAEQALIGYLLNTLPLRVRLGEGDTFRGLLSRVRETVIGALDYQALPFEKIIDAVRPPRNPGHAPLFQVLFVLRTEGDGRLDLPGVRVSPIGGRNDGAKFDVSLLLSDTPDGMAGVLEYNTDLFDEATARTLAEQYVALAGAVAADADAAVEALCIANVAERRTILEQFNRPASPAGGTVLDLWAEQVSHTSDAPAVVFGNEVLTYGELDARANALSHELLRRGVRREDRVGLYLRRSPHLMTALLGVMKAGAAYVPLDPTYPAERLMAMLADASVEVVLSETDLAPTPLLAGRQVLILDSDRPVGGAESLPVVRPGDLAYVLYTSGSTGKPKGVAVAHGPAWHLARWQREHSDCKAGTRTLQFTSLNFDVSFQEIFSTWCAGGALVLVDDLTRRDPDALYRHIVAHRVDRLFLPFVALQSLADAAIKPTAPAWQLREVMTAGEQLHVTPSVVQWFAAMPGCKLVNQYGPTETHVINTSLELTGDPHTWPAMPSIGRPIDHSRLYVLDGRRRLLPVGSPGDLFIGGACVARGYLNRPDLTAERFVADPFSNMPDATMYHTGDLARWSPDGTIQYLGRSDTQVKVQGYRIEPGEIEDALGQFPGVRQAAVVARTDATGTKRLIAYFVSDAEPDTKALRRHLATTLPSYMVPSAFVRLAALPLTGSNKIDRSALPEPVGRESDNAAQNRPAANATEQRLLDLWREVLGGSAIGVTDNFFDVGGHSILAVKLFSRIEKAFGRALPLSALFTLPTIAQLTPLLEADRSSVGDGVVIPLHSKGGGTPLFCLAGINGHVFSYRTLVKQMGGDRPVYGLQVEGLETDRAALERVEQIAAFLIGHMRRVQPHGPYALLGYSFGGTVAFEMARQLQAAGERVALLGILDSFATYAFPQKSLPARLAVHTRRLISNGPGYFCARLKSVSTSANLSAAERPTSPTERTASADSVAAAIQRVRYASDRAHRAYVPLPFDGVITLFQATRRPAHFDFLVHRPYNGWETLARRVDVHVVEGTHLTLLEGEGAAAIAATLRSL